MIWRIVIFLALLAATAVQAHFQTGLIVAGTGGGAVPTNNLSLHSSVQSAAVSSGTTVPVTLPTASTGDILIVYVVLNGSSSPTIADTGAQAWTLASSPVTSTTTASGAADPIIRWMAKASTNLTNDVITVTNGAALTFGVAIAMSITGANATPYDANASLPATLSGAQTDPITFSTSSSRDMVVACYRGVTANPTAGNIGSTSATLIAGANFQVCEYALVNSPQSSVTATLTTGAGGSNGGIVDAIVSQ